MNEKIDMVSLPKKSFWQLSVPIIAFCIFDAIYSIVDMAWVSQISVHASFAVDVSVPFVTLIIYLITRLNRPIISLLGFIVSAVILFTFMHSYGNESILWFIIAEIFIVFIILILKR